MKVKNSIIKKLLERYRTMSLLGSISAVLDWDMNVNLPEKGAEGRAEQASYITKLVNDFYHDPEFMKLLEEAKSQKDLSLEEKAVLRNLNKSAEYHLKVPPEILEEKTKTVSRAYMVWYKAKDENRFQDFLPYLKKLLELDRVIAKYLGYKDNPYDALLDLFNPGLSASFCEKNIVSLQPTLTALIKRVQKSKGYKAESDLVNGQKNYPREAQQKLSNFIAKKMGYDFSSGRIDVSPHPFTNSLGRGDVRITTMFKEKDFRGSFTATMHETGHALYEQNINLDFDRTPLEYGVSLGVHEAMSRFWENQIGRDPRFLKYMTSLFQAFFSDELRGADTETLVKLFNLAKPGFIRIEADELTYTLHIILRFEIENGLINGRIKPEELPGVWREKMKKYLGVEPETDRDGVLQDVHWAGGMFGYFPSYALGNLFASQILAKMKKDLDVGKALEKGELSEILKWLNEHVHKYGSLYWPGELIKVATGESLNPKYFLDYLNKKYAQIYNLKQ